MEARLRVFMQDKRSGGCPRKIFSSAAYVYTSNTEYIKCTKSLRKNPVKYVDFAEKT